VKKIIVCLAALAVILNAFSANNITLSYQIDWNKNVFVHNGQTEKLTFTEKGVPLITARIEVPFYGTANVKLVEKNLVAPKADMNFECDTSNFEMSFTSGIERKKALAYISLVPIRNNGNLQLLQSFDFVITQKRALSKAKSQSNKGQRAVGSVLASGDFYKMGVTQTGVHKLDFSFLNAMNSNVNGTSINNLRIFGDLGGMLPEPNAMARFNDPQEIALQVVDVNNNGTFENGDYILFYAEGPDKWTYDQTGDVYKFKKNIYSNQNFYFFNLGSNGKRIATNPSLSGAVKTITTFYGRAQHENDFISLLDSGKDWFGEDFHISQSTYSYNFNFPNIINTEPAHVATAAAARSLGSPSQFNYTIGGVTYNLNVGAIASTDLYTYARKSGTSFFHNNPSQNFGVTVDYIKTSSGAEAWLDYIYVNVKQQLSFNGGQLAFRNPNAQSTGNVQFNVNNASNTTIWDVTNAIEPFVQNHSSGSFTAMGDTIREYLAFDGTSFITNATAIGKIENQNIKGTFGQPDVIILTNPLFITAAEKLKDFHLAHSGLSSKIIFPDNIYNEFSSGAQDITAIRDFVKFVYDEAGGDPNLLPQHLLIIGDASYDMRNIENSSESNTNFVPSFQSPPSVSKTATYVTDDYFGLLDLHEGNNINNTFDELLDIAIGRLPVKSVQEANELADKLINYSTASNTFGDWRNNVAFVADDEDGNTHFIDAETLANKVEQQYQCYNVDKIYIDSYEQISGAGGSRYPAAKEAILNRIYQGALIVNYIGHGNPTSWAEERILNSSEVLNWSNEEKLPLFLTATCEFSRFDDPAIVSAGEKLLLNPNGGTVAMFTTVRLVFASANFNMANGFWSNVFEKVNGEHPTMGEILIRTKNGSNTAANNRKFTLLGNPAMKLNYANQKVKTTKINTVDYENGNDTLKALSKVTIEGEVRDENDVLLSGFNGLVYPTIFDKKIGLTTLANDPGLSLRKGFSMFKNIIFKGKASVTNGKFTFTFIVPKDINYVVGDGRISYYATSQNDDAAGCDTMLVGSIDNNTITDNKGPEIEIFMNDEDFTFGETTNENPLMIVKLYDENGMNTVGNGIGHDMTGLLDDNSQDLIVLNNFFESELDDYQRGRIDYPLNNLADGRHKMKVKAWDVFNNSGEGYTEFVVASSANVALEHVLNYPNPFTSSTEFMFEHNQEGNEIDIHIQVLTTSGKVVKSIRQNIFAENSSVRNIHWDGLDAYGNQLARGVYVYKVTVTSESNGANEHKYEKLVLLR